METYAIWLDTLEGTSGVLAMYGRGGPAQGQGVAFRQNAFSHFSLYWPKNQRHQFPKNGVFMKHSTDPSSSENDSL